MAIFKLRLGVKIHNVQNVSVTGHAFIAGNGYILLEEKQKLEKLAEGAKKKDLYHLVQDANHHFY